MPYTGEEQQLLLNVARQAIRQHLSAQTCEPPDVTSLNGRFPRLVERAGCFVTLHHARTRRLRGCVGRVDSPDPLLLTLHHAALSVLGDPRFEDDPVSLTELRHIEMEITVLSALKLASSCLDFEPLEHGIYLTAAGRAGCFLPQVARETCWTREQLLERLCTEKLCYPHDIWKHPGAKLFTFTAEIIGPYPFALLGEPPS